MADLGVITTRLLQQIGRKRIDTEAGDAGSVVSLDYTTTLSGTVKIGSTPVPNADVWLFNRATKLPVQRTLSAADGSFPSRMFCRFQGLISRWPSTLTTGVFLTHRFST